MTLETGSSVRLVVDLMADSGEIIEAGSKGVVIGFAGLRPVIRVDDQETDTSETTVAEPWEVRPA